MYINKNIAILHNLASLIEQKTKLNQVHTVTYDQIILHISIQFKHRIHVYFQAAACSLQQQVKAEEKKKKGLEFASSCT